MNSEREKTAFLESFSEEEWLLNGHQKSDLSDILSIYNFFIHFVKDGNYLELGCGSGILAKYLRLFSGKKIIPYGIDLNNRSIALAKVNNHEFENNFITGDYLIDNCFETVDFSTVFLFISTGSSLESIVSIIKRFILTRQNILIVFYDNNLLSLKNDILNRLKNDGETSLLISSSGDYFIHLSSHFRSNHESP